MEKILELLNSNDWIVNNEVIEIAKGKYELPTTIKGALNKAKRNRETKKYILSNGGHK